MKLQIVLLSLIAVCAGCTLDDINPPGPPCPPRLFVSEDGTYRQFSGYDVRHDGDSGYFYLLPDYEVLDESELSSAARAEARKHVWEGFEEAVMVNSKARHYTSEESAKSFSINLNHIAISGSMICVPGGSCEGEDNSGIWNKYNFDNEFMNNRCPNAFNMCDLEYENDTYNYYCRLGSLACTVNQDCYKAGIAGWEAGRCERGECIASACMSGYMLQGGRCVALDCPSGTHVYSNPETGMKDCEADDENNCGAHGFGCDERVPGWVSGSCQNAACIADACDVDAGYDLKDGKCLAACVGTQVKCGGLCRDALTDNDYCGATGTVNSCSTEGEKCSSGKVCVGGKCIQNTCSGDTPDICEITYEDGSKKNECRNVRTDDADHCGACNYVCANNPTATATASSCVAGVCQYECKSGYTKCSDNVTAEGIICIKDEDFLSDGNNCGGCGISCKTDEACANGKCVQNSCSGANPDLCVVDGKNTCKNTKSDDSAHCGACNYACANNPAANAVSNTCKDGVCQYTCDSGYINCGGSTASQIKCVKTTDMQTDGQNCGACGKVCGAEEACVGGKCVQNSCSGNTPDLCVVNGQNVCKRVNGNDADHCGACNYKCSNNPVANATSNTCSNGVCQYICNSGYTNCGGVTAASINCIKTTDLQTDGQNCGSCGNVCGAGKACVNGQCVQNSCSGANPDLCVVAGKNVCKNTHSSDSSHCGACNYACANNPATHATSNTCSNGVCQYTCDNGYTNCGGVTASSIRCIKTTDLQTDGSNCGSCGNVCAQGKACVNGGCVQGSCSGATPDLCVVNGNNVCKNINGSDASHCGACNYSCSAHPLAHATSNSCSAGQCLYTCSSGYANAGNGNTADKIHCIKIDSDPNNCGAANHRCDPMEVCAVGVCQPRPVFSPMIDINAQGGTCIDTRRICNTKYSSIHCIAGDEYCFSFSTGNNYACSSSYAEVSVDGYTISSIKNMKFYEYEYDLNLEDAMSDLVFARCSKNISNYTESSIEFGENFCERMSIICGYNSLNKKFYKFIVLIGNEEKLLYWMPDVTP